MGDLDRIYEEYSVLDCSAFNLDFLGKCASAMTPRKVCERACVKLGQAQAGRDRKALSKQPRGLP